jgi:hypothetical protein
MTTKRCTWVSMDNPLMLQYKITNKGDAVIDSSIEAELILHRTLHGCAGARCKRHLAPAEASLFLVPAVQQTAQGGFGSHRAAWEVRYCLRKKTEQRNICPVMHGSGIWEVNLLHCNHIAPLE